MKRAGIWISKGRREVHERNLAHRMPQAPAVEVLPGPDGTMVIHGRRYSPEAAAIYQKHGAVHMIASDVAVTGLGDPWLARTSPQAEAVDADAALRLAQVQAYYDDQTRRRPDAWQVPGTSDWMAD